MSVTELFPDGQSYSERVAGNVRAEAARAGFSQSSLARAMNVTQPRINRRWRGLTAWSLDELEQVSAIIGCGVFDLVAGNDVTETAHVESVGRAARLKGLEPPTFWYGVAPVIDLFTRRRFA